MRTDSVLDLIDLQRMIFAGNLCYLKMKRNVNQFRLCQLIVQEKALWDSQKAECACNCRTLLSLGMKKERKKEKGREVLNPETQYAKWDKIWY